MGNIVLIAIFIVIGAFGISVILTFLGSTNAPLNFILSFVVSSFLAWIFYNKNNPKIKVDVPKESIKEKEPEIVEYSDNEVKFFGFFFWLSSAALLILIVLGGLSLSY